jgi:hypothetical protein
MKKSAQLSQLTKTGAYTVLTVNERYGDVSSTTRGCLCRAGKAG